MTVTEFGIVIFASFVQVSNAYFPMVVTELPMDTLVNAPQLLNANSPMEVTESPIVMFVRSLQPTYLQLFVYQLILIKTVEKRLCRFYRG